MRIVILSGGSGERLWPLSNHVRSKQFLQVLKDPQGRPESMLQRVLRQIRGEHIPLENVTIATGASQADIIRRQAGDGIRLVIEPQRRNTFPAIALSAMHLFDVQKADPDEVVAVMPVDVYAEQKYFRLFADMEAVLRQRQKPVSLVLMGIRPDGPSEQFGYIVPEREACDGFQLVSSFAEKPKRARAEELIRQGALWNGGVFAFRLQWLLDLLQKYTPVRSFEALRREYGCLPRNSFDYEIVEKTEQIAAVSYEGIWQDLGTWDALTGRMDTEVAGNVHPGPGNENTHLINELDIPMISIGLKNAVICATPDGILAADKTQASRIKEVLEADPDGGRRPMYEQRRWGTYTVVDRFENEKGEKSLTKHLVLEDGTGTSYQRHSLRDEVWIVAAGKGEAVIDGKTTELERGMVLQIGKGSWHSVKGLHDLHIIEIQLGTELTEEDIERKE